MKSTTRTNPCKECGAPVEVGAKTGRLCEAHHAEYMKTARAKWKATHGGQTGSKHRQARAYYERIGLQYDRFLLNAY